VATANVLCFLVMVVRWLRFSPYSVTEP
jgi:hypothetical protein